MNQDTGKFITGLEHLRQSIKLILNTPIGSRVMLPEFGSEIIDLIDLPMTPTNELKFYAATIEAVERWEKRVQIQRVKIDKRSADGTLSLTIDGIYEEREVTLLNIPIMGTS